MKPLDCPVTLRDLAGFYSLPLAVLRQIVESQRIAPSFHVYGIGCYAIREILAIDRTMHAIN